MIKRCLWRIDTSVCVASAQVARRGSSQEGLGVVRFGPDLFPPDLQDYIRVMFADLLGRLARPDPDPLDQDDARLALAALLVRIARSDGDYSETERQRIQKILAQRHNLSEHEALGLRSEAEAMEAEAPDTVRFTRAIKDAVPYEERTAVIEALWAVVLADGVRDAEEDALLRLVANLLGINDRDSALARQRVEQARG